MVYNVGIDKIIIVEDFGASSYRKELYPDYKGNRDKREYTKEQKDRLDLMYAWMAQLDEFKAFFPSIRVKNVEADDIIMLLYKQLTSEGQECVVISQDKDYITGIDIKHLYDWKAQEFFSLEKKAKGLKPNKFKMLQGYIGDHIDHIPSICGEKTALILIDNFKTLDDSVIELRAKLAYQKNIELSNEILASSKEYINNFNAVASKIVENQNNGIKEETEQIKNTIKTMSESGVVLESKIVEINKNALQLKDEAHSLLSNILLILVVVSVLVFIAFSLLISNIVTKSLTDFKNGLLSFFDYLNKKTTKISLLEDSAKDEFGEMALFVNENIKQVENTLNQDIALIEDAKVVMTRVNNGWYGQFIEKSTSNASLEEFKKSVNEMISKTNENYEQSNYPR